MKAVGVQALKVVPANPQEEGPALKMARETVLMKVWGQTWALKAVDGDSNFAYYQIKIGDLAAH